MIKKICFMGLAATFCLMGEISNAQTKDSSTVIIFNSGANGTKVKPVGEDNIIKVAPIGFISGKIPLVYERSFTDFFSINLSAGLTSRNYTRSLWRESLRETEAEGEMEYESSPLPDGVSDNADPIHNFDNRKAQVGYMLSLQPRLYFPSEGLEGNFVAISLDYYRYNFTIPGLSKGSSGLVHSGAAKKEYENIRDFMGYYGWQTLYDRLSVEYTFGIGLRSVSGSKYSAGEDSANKFYEGSSKYSNTDINFGIGFRVGYHF